jgi:hypothetical protein
MMMKDCDNTQLSITSIPKTIIDARDMMYAELELKECIEDLKLENAEIVFYDTLLRISEKGEIQQAISPLTQNLDEERSIARQIEAFK